MLMLSDATAAFLSPEPAPDAQLQAVQELLHTLLATAKTHGYSPGLLAFADHDGGLSRLLQDTGVAPAGVAAITSTEGLIATGFQVVSVINSLAFAKSAAGFIARQWGDEATKADRAIAGNAKLLLGQLQKRGSGPLAPGVAATYLERRATLSALQSLARLPAVYERICDFALPVEGGDVEAYCEMIAQLCRDLWRAFGIIATPERHWQYKTATPFAKLEKTGTLVECGWRSIADLTEAVHALEHCAVTHHIAEKSAHWVLQTRAVNAVHSDDTQRHRDQAIAYVGRIALFMMNQMIAKWTTHIAHGLGQAINNAQTH